MGYDMHLNLLLLQSRGLMPLAPLCGSPMVLLALRQVLGCAGASSFGLFRLSVIYLEFQYSSLVPWGADSMSSGSVLYLSPFLVP